MFSCFRKLKNTTIIVKPIIIDIVDSPPIPPPIPPRKSIPGSTEVKYLPERVPSIDKSNITPNPLF